MANIGKNAVITYNFGKACGLSKIRFHIPEEMQYSFPISDLFKHNVISFNVKKFEFIEAEDKKVVSLHCEIQNIKTLKAVISYTTPISLFSELKDLLSQPIMSCEDEDKGILLLNKINTSFPPIIQILPTF